jgi:hypothetical protein
MDLMDSLAPIVPLDVFFNFKGPWAFKIKTYDFSALMHFIVGLVNVEAASNFHGNSAPQDATMAKFY